MLNFKEFYAKKFYKAKEGQHWAGDNMEMVEIVLERLADAFAAYADYVAGQSHAQN